jgi:hypothetical protein
VDRKKKIAVVALALGAAALLLLRRKTAQSAEPAPAVPPPATLPPSTYTGPSYSSDFGAKTFDDLLPLIREQALDMGVDPLVLQAIMSVESNEKGWGPTGRVLLRFEPHVFFRETGRTVLLPGMTEPVASQTGRRRGGQSEEWQAYETASEIDAEAAAQSTSWGIGQIMGFNHKAIGYSSAVEMVADFDARLEAQLIGMVKFIRSNSRAYNALLRSDLPAFVDAYNGADVGTTGNNRYVSKMRDYIYRAGA